MDTGRIATRQNVGMDAVATARAFVESAHPGAAAAVLGGSVADGTATASSDLDVALLYDDSAVNYAETVEFSGWHIGDNPSTDVAGALAAGLCAVWLNRSGRDRAHDEPVPTLEVRSLVELVAALG